MIDFRRKNPSMWEIEVLCTGQENDNNGCESSLVINENDIFVTAHFDSMCEEFFYTFQCPRCGKLTDVPKNEIPRAIRKKAMREYRKEHIL